MIFNSNLEAHKIYRLVTGLKWSQFSNLYEELDILFDHESHSYLTFMTPKAEQLRPCLWDRLNRN